MLSTKGVQLTKTFPAEAFRDALESWSWLPLAGKVPVLATAFGDVASLTRSPRTATSWRLRFQAPKVKTSTCWQAWLTRPKLRV